MKIKTKIAKFAALSSRFILKKILRRDGAFYPGKLAMKIDNNILANVKDCLDKSSVLVTGTNGKTSVTALLANCMEAQSCNVASNRSGANLESGVVSALLDYKIANKDNIGIFEVDELWVKSVLSKLKSRYLIILNLFPDQVDRFGGIDTIQTSLIEALKLSPETTLIYNADDPNCQLIADACDNHCIAFGLNEKITTDAVDDKILCPQCQDVLNYSLRQYAQLGIYKCSKCGFNRANIDYEACEVKITANTLKFKLENTEYSSKNALTYVCYNLLAFILCAKNLGANIKNIKLAIATQKNNARLEHFLIDNIDVMINLAKNPAGFNQNIDFILKQIDCAESNKKFGIAFFVNAREGDGRDTHWLEDVNFYKLSGQKNINIYFGGEAKDKLKTALSKQNIYARCIENAKNFVDSCRGCSNLFIIANYTAVFVLRDELQKLVK